MFIISQLSNLSNFSAPAHIEAEALEHYGTPEIFNTDQGSQFTCEAFTSKLKGHGIQGSMDGKGRALDNRMIERLWRSVKYDDIYIRGYESMGELRNGLRRYFEKYNNRAHQGIGEQKPADAYHASQLKEAA